ncbi:MAG: hypothetical protein ACKOPB_05820 [Actinomycetota bacterium]
MKITAVAKGDCAQNATTIVVTTATTTCLIEISVTPAKRYADVALIEPLDGTSFTFPMFYASKNGIVKVNTKGKAVIEIAKTYVFPDGSECLISGGTERVFAQVTNASAPLGSFTAAAKSKSISVTFKQIMEMDDCSVTLTR